MVYEPNKPYIFQSGKREGKALEVLMFNEPGFIPWQLNLIRKRKNGSNKNALEKHLEWLIAKGETREPQMICPQCNKERVEYFSVRYSYDGRDFSISPAYTCCDSARCTEKLKAMAGGRGPHFFRIRWSSITRVTTRKSDQKRVADVFRHIFNLPYGKGSRLTAEKAFEFFSS